MSAAERWDVVVVGAGPAGSAVAARLAGLGHRTLLLDRADFPRRKPCGECLNPAAVAALERLGALDAVRAAGGSALRGWRIRAADGTAFDGDFPAGRDGWAIPRDRLDAVLVEHARRRGAEVRFGVRVTDLARDGAVVTGVRARAQGSGETTLGARLVIGADGLRSVVLRRLALLRRTPRLRKLALVAHVRGLPSLHGRGELRAGPDGCVGIAETGEGEANVTVVLAGARADAAGDADGCFDRALRSYGLRGAARTERVLATGPFDWPVRCAVADGALLVGDAGGYYDPFTGQGIFRALSGAEVAARVADAALRRGPVTAAALAPYERFRRRGRASVALQHAIEAALARPRLFGAVASRLARRPSLADALIRVTGDLAPVRSLLHPALLARWVG